MTISAGDTLPEARFNLFAENGPEFVSLSDYTKGRKVVIFALPGAFSRTCSAAHLPSFIRTHDAFRAKGVDQIICVSVNDPFVMKAWGESSGAAEAGIAMLGDADSSFTKAIGMNFTAPIVGFHDRSVRYAMLVEDGVVKVLQTEEESGTCELTTGEALLAAI